MKKSGSIILSIQLTEKSAELAEKERTYLFKVAPSANKVEIRQAVEDLFKVSVEKVNTMNMKGKRKRQRTARYGKRADWKRAVVKLKEGSNIELV
jgi:large subunit ribosomal protein L23